MTVTSAGLGLKAWPRPIALAIHVNSTRSATLLRWSVSSVGQ